MAEAKKFYTVNEFLEYYPMGRSTLYRLVGSGALQMVKFGRSSRIAVEAADAWAATLPRRGGASNDNGR